MYGWLVTIALPSFLYADGLGLSPKKILLDSWNNNKAFIEKSHNARSIHGLDLTKEIWFCLLAASIFFIFRIQHTICTPKYNTQMDIVKRPSSASLHMCTSLKFVTHSSRKPFVAKWYPRHILQHDKKRGQKTFVTKFSWPRFIFYLKFTEDFAKWTYFGTSTFAYPNYSQGQIFVKVATERVENTSLTD